MSSDANVRAGAGADGPAAAPQARAFPVMMGMVVLLAIYQFLFGRFFPNNAGRIGHDYSGVLPQLLAGDYWFHNNGALAVPWFTPAFCGGVPYFADPQTMYYSLAQWLTFVMDPLRAIQVSLLAFAAVGFWGMYLFCRRVMNASREAAFVAALVFMFNGFYGFRMVVGHYNFHSFMVAPWLAWALSDGLTGRVGEQADGATRRDLPYVLHIGLMLAYTLQAGLGTLVIPVALAILAMLLVAGLQPGGLVWQRLLLRGVLGALLAACISSAHISASAFLMSNFPRAEYRLPGFASLFDSAWYAARTLFLPGGSIAEDGAQKLVNVQWLLSRHEYEYGVGLAPLLALVGLAVAGIRARLNVNPLLPKPAPRGAQPAVLVVLLIAVLLLPIALNTYQEDWNHLLKQTPVLSSSSTLIRWLLIYVPVLALVCAPAVDRVPVAVRTYAVAVAAVLTLGALAVTDTSDYQDEPYPPRRILSAYNRFNATALTPPVANLVEPVSEAGMVQRNDALTEGASTIHCYYPTFGYRLEHLPFRDLQVGPSDMVHGEGEAAHYNLKNPACYAFPGANHCAPGDHFRVSQKDQARDFASYKPFQFEMPVAQLAANQIAFWTLLLALFAEVACLAAWVRGWRARP